jgi:hypothetical protein
MTIVAGAFAVSRPLFVLVVAVLVVAFVAVVVSPLGATESSLGKQPSHHCDVLSLSINHVIGRRQSRLSLTAFPRDGRRPRRRDQDPTLQSP